MAIVTLLSAVTTDTDGTSFNLEGGQGTTPSLRKRDGLFGLYVFSAGTFDSATLTIQVSLDDTIWFVARSRNDNQAIFTVADHMILDIRALWIRARLNGIAAPPLVNPITVSFL